MSFVDQHVYIIKTFIPGLTVCYYHVGFFFEQLYIKRLGQIGLIILRKKGLIISIHNISSDENNFIFHCRHLVQNVRVNFYPAYPWHPDISENHFIDSTGAEYIQCSFAISNSIY